MAQDGEDLPTAPASDQRNWAKYAVDDIWDDGPYLMTIDVIKEVYERLGWTEGLLEDERLAAGLQAVGNLAMAAARVSSQAAAVEDAVPEELRAAIDAQNRELDSVLTLAEKWWDSGPIWSDGSHSRDTGPYSDEIQDTLEEVWDEIDSASRAIHGKPWDQKTDAGIPGIKTWRHALQDDQALVPWRALWFEGVEWRWYSDKIPCGGLRCTVEMSGEDIDAWYTKIVEAINAARDSADSGPATGD